MAWYVKHQPLIKQAISATKTREHFSPFPEMPSPRVYGDEASAAGQAAFEQLLGQRFELSQPAGGQVVTERQSPWGLELGVSYASLDWDTYKQGHDSRFSAIQALGPEERAGMAAEVLTRLNARSFEIALAVQHTSGQGYMMAFQAGGPHAQDRGLEAVAYALKAQLDSAPSAVWEKPQGKHPALVMEKRFVPVGRGISLVIGCSTFPTWNTYPGLFASFTTGNPVVVKAHPGAILPAAITVQVFQEVLSESGLPTDLVCLAVDDVDQPIAKQLAMDPAVKLIDYTGNSEFGDWLEANAPGQVFSEKAGVNLVLVDSLPDAKKAFQNLAFSLALYSGQMCTTPQAILVPKSGVPTEDGTLTIQEFAEALKSALDNFLSDPDRASMVLGRIHSDATLARVKTAQSADGLIRESQIEGRQASPCLFLTEADNTDWQSERFGPIAFVVVCDDVEDVIAKADRSLIEKGAITLGVYTTDENVREEFIDLSQRCGVALSINLDGGVFVNQSAAFSDFHATGANPAANASLTDLAFVADRFRVIQHRWHS